MQALRLNPFQATFWLRNTKASATMTNTVWNLVLVLGHW
jgi:hypothetical protein